MESTGERHRGRVGAWTRRAPNAWNGPSLSHSCDRRTEQTLRRRQNFRLVDTEPVYPRPFCEPYGHLMIRRSFRENRQFAIFCSWA